MTQSLLRSLTFSSRTARRTFVATVATSAALYYFFYPDKSRSAPTAADARLSPTRFTPLRIVSADHVGPDSLLLTVHVPPHQRPDVTPVSKKSAHGATFAPDSDYSRVNGLAAAHEPIWSVFIKDDAIQVERPFTPLEGIDADGNMSFWIKRYRDGEVSRWLHTKTAGEHLEMRGPLQTWLWDPKEYEHVYMISGGTGITPFYQLFCSVITHTAKDALPESQFSTPSAIQVPITPSATQTPTPALAPRFTLLHSSRRIEEFPPEKILRPLLSFADAHPERLRVHLFVDEAPESATSSSKNLTVLGHPVHIRRIGKPDIQACLDDVYVSDAPWWRRSFWPWKSEQLVGAANRAPPSSTESDPLSGRKKILFLVCGPEPMVRAIAGPYGRNFSQGPVAGILGELQDETATSVWKL